MKYLWILALAGCGPSLQQRLVMVTDPAGAPVPGAEVRGISDSLTTGPALTDAGGFAPAPATGPQTLRWIAVSAPGFEAVQVNAPATWPLRVVLRRTP
jgi:hypothetical protein